MDDNKEKGTVMVEATIYYPIIILVIGVIIVVSLMKLQQCLIVAALTGATDMVSAEAMCGNDEAYQLEDSDSLISILSVVKSDNQIVEVKSTGSMVKTVNIKMEYKIEPPGFVKTIFRGTSVERNWPWSRSIADVTTLTMNPRYMVDTMDQHILFRSSGGSGGNLMMAKYAVGFWEYLNKQY